MKLQTAEGVSLGVICTFNTSAILAVGLNRIPYLGPGEVIG